MKLRNHWKNILFTALAFLLFLPAAAFPSRADEFPGAYEESRGPGNPGGASPETAKVQEDEAGLGGAELIMYPCADPKLQCLSCLIRTSDGKLIVVDGGLGEDAPRLRDEILSRGGEVTAWLLTHPHGDHAGALYRILEEEDARRQSGIGSEIVIDAVHSARFSELNTVQDLIDADTWGREYALERIRSFNK